MSLAVMKQALEALQEAVFYLASEYTCVEKECEDAITALRAAIKEAQGLAEKIPAKGTLLEQTLKDVWDEMPHTAMMDAIIGGTGVMLVDKRIDPASIYKQPEQKPVGWFGYDEKISTWFETNEGEDDSVPLYAGARGWEGLTPEETVGIELSLRKYHDGDRYDLSLSDFARAIEAKLLEKNT